MDLSIIIPVYNVENYLKKCVLSVLNTTLPTSKFEILLINDGSTDESPFICQDIERKHKNVRAFHKKNGGLSDARNYGLIRAKGDYIAFVDSDDFVIKDAYNILLEKALEHGADIALGNAFKYIDHNNIYPKFKRRDNDLIIQNGEEFLVNSIKNNTMSMSVVLGIYRRKFLLNKKHFFKKGLLHEDELWTPITYLDAKKVIYVNHNFYYHFERKGSITQRKDKTQNALDLISICCQLDNIYNQVSNRKSRGILKDYLCMLYLNAAYVGKLHKGKYKKNLDVLFPIKRAKTPKNILKSILFMISNNFYFKLNNTVKDKKDFS
ncbi:glycosyltransferase [Aerococcus urinaeequi]|uniref:glycosyltransferase n=1 Tax=Aerococcus urinaeequi TaxID=51665 RepID=UPI003D6B29D7